ncbi:MAG: transcriptional regulator [Candidatus Aenigmatarchaeota archaeon]
MKLSCEVFVNEFLPAIRAIIARDLIEEHDLTQRETARRLDTTQPAISQYKNKLRGRKVRKIEESKSVRKKVEAMIEDIAKQRIDKEDYDERFCEICEAARKESLIEKRFTCEF